MKYENLNGVEVTDKITIYNCDNMDLLRQTPDNYYSLSIVDPPYGLGMAKERPRKDGRFAGNIPKEWDNATPDADYFQELKRVSKNQIIWGGNYFDLPPNQCFIFWYKRNPVDNFSDGELAWTSFKKPASCFDFQYYGNICGKTSAPTKIHISQKPVALYKWLLEKYAKQDDKILDTHLGSGSIAIACNELGFELTACELDKDYFDATVKRLNNKFGNEFTFDDAPANQTNIFQQTKTA